MLQPPIEAKGLRPLPSFIRWSRIILALTLGMGYLLGPPQFSSSPIFYYIKATPLSIQGWGLLFILCAVLLMFTHLAGYAVTAFVWLVWSCLLIAAVLTGHIAGWGGVVWPLYFAVANVYELRVWAQQKVERIKEEGIESIFRKWKSDEGARG